MRKAALVVALIFIAVTWFFFPELRPPDATTVVPEMRELSPIGSARIPPPGIKATPLPANVDSARSPQIALDPPQAASSGENEHHEELDGLLRDPRGQVIRVRRSGAENICIELGKRLATIRELVIWRGKLREESKFNEANLEPGENAQLIDSLEADGGHDRFYNLYTINPSAPLSADRRANWIWSSSLGRDRPEAYAFDLQGGYIALGESEDPDPAYHFGAIRCVDAKAK